MFAQCMWWAGVGATCALFSRLTSPAERGVIRSPSSPSPKGFFLHLKHVRKSFNVKRKKEEEEEEGENRNKEEKKQIKFAIISSHFSVSPASCKHCTEAHSPLSVTLYKFPH
jgi:hypothetical protein